MTARGYVGKDLREHRGVQVPHLPGEERARGGSGPVVLVIPVNHPGHRLREHLLGLPGLRGLEGGSLEGLDPLRSSKVNHLRNFTTSSSAVLSQNW